METGSMIRVLRGNRERLIPPMEKEKYLADGYSVIGEDGSLLEQGVKSNHTLKTELEAAGRRTAELEAELRQYREAAVPEDGGDPAEAGESGADHDPPREEKKRGRKAGLA